MRSRGYDKTPDCKLEIPIGEFYRSGAHKYGLLYRYILLFNAMTPLDLCRPGLILGWFV